MHGPYKKQRPDCLCSTCTDHILPDDWGAKRKRIAFQTQERPDERDIRAGAENAEYRSGSDAKKGERLLLGT